MNCLNYKVQKALCRTYGTSDQLFRPHLVSSAVCNMIFITGDRIDGHRAILYHWGIDPYCTQVMPNWQVILNAWPLKLMCLIDSSCFFNGRLIYGWRAGWLVVSPGVTGTFGWHVYSANWPTQSDWLNDWALGSQNFKDCIFSVRPYISPS